MWGWWCAEGQAWAACVQGGAHGWNVRLVWCWLPTGCEYRWWLPCFVVGWSSCAGKRLWGLVSGCGALLGPEGAGRVVCWSLVRVVPSVIPLSVDSLVGLVGVGAGCGGGLLVA